MRPRMLHPLVCICLIVLCSGCITLFPKRPKDTTDLPICFAQQVLKAGPPVSITQIGARPGTCGAPPSASPGGGDAVVFLQEPFSIRMTVSTPSPAPGRSVRIAVGTDAGSAGGRTVPIDPAASGEVSLCADGFTIGWPGIAQIQAESFENGEWKSRREHELAVVPRDSVNVVLFPRNGHPSRRIGSSYRLSSTFRLSLGAYAVNGTDQARTLSQNIRGILAAGSGSTLLREDWSTTMPQPFTVAPYSVTPIHRFTVDVRDTSPLWDMVENDKVVMLGSVVSGETPPSRPEFKTIDWKAMKGMAAKVVFVGDYTMNERINIMYALVSVASGYLQSAGVTLNNLSYGYSGAEVGMSPGEIDEFKSMDVGDVDKQVRMTSFQPPRSVPGLTLYVVENLAGAAGFIGRYVGGGLNSSDPLTPFRCPIIEVAPGTLADTVVTEPQTLYHLRDQNAEFYVRRNWISVVGAHEIAHALGLNHTVEDSCSDLDTSDPADKMNMMNAYSFSYSWVLSDCQKGKIRQHPEYYIY